MRSAHSSPHHEFETAGRAGFHLGPRRNGIAVKVLVAFHAEHAMTLLDGGHHLPAVVALQMPQTGVDGALQPDVILDLAQFALLLDGNQIGQVLLDVHVILPA